jgi:hypothetical protein
MNKFIIPQINPVKFYHQSEVFNTQAFTLATYGAFDPNINTRTIDQDFFALNIPSWADQVKYAKPFQQGDKLVLNWQGQDDSVTGPYHVRFINCKGELVKSVLATKHATAVGSYYIWYCSIPMFDIPEGIYFVQLLCQGFLTEPDYFCISEPIHIKQKHENTKLFKYWSSYNNQGAFYEIPRIKFESRYPASLVELLPSSEFEVYQDQPLNLTLLSGTPFREWRLEFAVDNKYFTQNEIDHIERMSLSDYWYADGLRITRNDNSKLEVGRQEKNPLVSVSITVRETINDQDLQVNELIPIPINNFVYTDNWAYLGSVYYTFGTSSTTVNLAFYNSINLVNYLNTVLLSTNYDENTYFAINAKKELVLITDDAGLHTVFSAGVDLLDYMVHYVELDLKTITGETDLECDIVCTTSTRYALVHGDGSANTTGAITTGALSKTYTANKSYTARWFFEPRMESMDFNPSEQIVYGLGGKLSPIATLISITNNKLRYIKNNIFTEVQGTLVDTLVDVNNLSTNEINKLALYIYDSPQAFNNTITADQQTPLAPPTDDIGMSNILKAISDAGIIFATD